MESDSVPLKDLLRVHCEAAAKLNFACHQSDFAVLRDLRIENTSEEFVFEDLVVSVESDPAFIEPRRISLDRVGPGAEVSVRIDDLKLNGQFLLDLQESVRGTLKIRVAASDTTLVEHQQALELLARNEWGGASFMPELLAAFCMPNDPAVDRVLSDASEILRKAGKADGIDGYRSGSRQRVWEITSAIYAAVANLRLKYAIPPTSFEANGQKIRVPSQILSGGVATCLDSTMLLASAFEQAGLNPLVALLKEHALVGVWLQPEKLTSVTNEEAEVLRKRGQLQELVLIESTLLTQHPTPPFSRAIERANAQLDPENDSNFVTTIDIARARAHQINPLGKVSDQEAPESQKPQKTTVNVALEQAPPLPDFDQEEDDQVPETPGGRLDRWQRKLLDLSARNPLLNHRSPKSSVTVLCPDPGKLEDKIASGKKISITALPTATGEHQDEALHERRTGKRIDESYALDALEHNQVVVDLPRQELDKRMIEIYRKTHTSLQEGGANTLYLALGFLLWKRDAKDTRRFRAPLILMPVSIQRKSVRSGVKIFAHDDEPRFNTTLIELLRKDYGIELGSFEGSLPEDEHGVDVHEVWTRVRRAIKEAPGFEVVEDVVLGHFSFAKYLMWKDLVDRTDDLRRSGVVKHLIDTPRDPYSSDGEFVAKEALDRDYQPSDFLTPLPADSSQMAAIASADSNKDFIIIGPPGTGKSQTISNMIAHLLGKGKSVLFISEKTAALDVVHRRLEEIGLGRYCLQLHSNKAKKADVLAQLNGSWEHGASRTGDQWRREAAALGALRDRLNRVVEHMHRKWRNGLTAFYAIGVKVRDAHLADLVPFEWPSADQHSEHDLSQLREAAGRLRVQAEAVGPFGDSPFLAIRHEEWSPTWQGSMQTAAGALETSAQKLDEARTRLLAALKIDIQDLSWRGLENLTALCATLQDAYRKRVSHAIEPDGLGRIEALEEAITQLKAYAREQGNLSCSYDPMAWRQLDGELIATRYKEAQNSWFGKRFLAGRKLLKELRAGGAKGKPDIQKDARTLAKLRLHGEQIDRLDRVLSALDEWDGHSSDVGELGIHQDVAQRLRRDVSRIASSLDDRITLIAALKQLLDEGNDLLGPEGPIGRATSEFLEHYEQLESYAQDFSRSAGRELRDHFQDSESVLEDLRSTAREIQVKVAALREWCQWQQRRNEALDLDLGGLVRGVEDARIPAAEIEQTFEAAYCSWFSERVFDEDEVIRTFSSAEHADVIRQFRAADEAFMSTTARYVGALLSQEIPGQGEVPKSSQWGILKREITKRARHKPVRQLMKEASDAVTKLAPCLMMSPLSVAQYLSPDQALFDVVIFDEASQITVWDAVGAIARGRQLVVAGDPKQMPPTNFFARIDDGWDGAVEGDMESILDELRSSNIPERTLNLHYRSRRESLIAFSNCRYYDNGLVTFPAPFQPDRGVRLVRPDGHYDRGGSRTNRGEAEAIVHEVVRRLTSDDSSLRDQSLGVVTFNSEQQSLIQDLLDQERASRPEIEWAFNEDRVEPVFVKNLETVQGDERDVILFSITYGPDAAGHLTMNFGPLNKQGGERRLNVAMTRARFEMMVFSTLEPERIDLSRTSARAVADLKHFLDYAQHGPRAIAAADRGSVGGYDSPFESAVASRLRDRGWEVLPQIGVSAYRVDLGIVHPDKPGRFLAGIECDGAMYHSSQFARERDKVRQSVLEGLGWKLLRIWSTDWWVDPAGSVEKLDQDLRRLLEGEHASSEPLEDEAMGEGERAISEDAQLAARAGSEVSPAGAHESEKAEDERPHTTPYVAAQVEIDTGAVELGLANPRSIVDAIVHVVEVESPIHEDDLIRRITLASGLQRAGSRVQQTVLDAARLACQRGEVEKRGDFYWKPGEQLAVPRDRSHFAPQEKKFDRVACEEVEAAICRVVQLHFSISTSDAISEAAQRLGFRRVTAPMKAAMLATLEQLCERGLLARRGDLVCVASDTRTPKEN
ncbi:MAG: DNA helicase [Planctomycetes bacterium]|nr:DNA helicase [Planctomycetota bacterium]